jgi:hypothetical protein
MKVGDLVKKTGIYNTADTADTGKLGIIVGVEASYDHYFVCWGDYGTFWTPAHCLEIVNESR